MQKTLQFIGIGEESKDSKLELFLLKTFIANISAFMGIRHGRKNESHAASIIGSLQLPKNNFPRVYEKQKVFLYMLDICKGFMRKN